MASRKWIFLGGVSGFIAVLLGAFGAHVLEERVPTNLLENFETGARYQMFHSLALVAVGLLSHRSPSRAARTAGWAFTLGTVLFSGSLYVMALTGETGWGAVTPFGGLGLLVGWAALAVTAFQIKD